MNRIFVEPGTTEKTNIFNNGGRNFMLTAKENMREVVRGGNPDRVVNQFEAMQLLMHPAMASVQ